MSKLISMDPGLRDCWLAYFEDGKLSKTLRARNPETKERGPKAWLAMGRAVYSSVIWEYGDGHFVSEIPQVYTFGKQKGDQDDITQLSGIVGAVVQALNPGSVSHYYPREWKGQMPKEPCNQLVLDRLSQSEGLNVGIYGALQHNILDAIGIGLKYLKRFETGSGVGKSLTAGEISARLEARLRASQVDFKK